MTRHPVILASILAAAASSICGSGPAVAQWCVAPDVAVLHASGGFYPGPGGTIKGEGYLGSPVDGLYPVLPDSICVNIETVAAVGDLIPPPPGADPATEPVSVDPPTRAFWHPVEMNLYANETGQFDVVWSAGVGTIARTYQVLRAEPTVALYKTETPDYGPPVRLDPAYAAGRTVVLHYNSTIQGTGGSSNPANDAFIDSATSLRARKAGVLLLEYQSAADGGLVAFEVVQVRNNTPVVYHDWVVGTPLAPSWTYDYANFPWLTTGDNEYVFQYPDLASSGPSRGHVYPTSATVDPADIEVYWFQSSQGVVWPAEFSRYTSVWPEPSVTMFLTEGFNDGPPVALAPIIDGATQADVILHYNSVVSGDRADPADTANGAFIDTARNLHAGTEGLLLLEYRRRGAVKDHISFEIIDILPPPADNTAVVEVGAELLPALPGSVVPPPANPAGVCIPYIAAGAGVFVHQQPEAQPGPTRWNIYAVRPTSPQVFTDIRVYWYLWSQGVSWPVERRLYSAVWPPQPQINVRGAPDDPAVDMSAHTEARIMYASPAGHAAVGAAGHSFTTISTGTATVMYTDSVPIEGDTLSFEVVQTVGHETIRENTIAVIGDRILDPAHDAACNDGYLFSGANYDPGLYTKTTSGGRVTAFGGPVFPVNTGNIEMWWYRTSQDVCWPVRPVLYSCVWPPAPDRCIIIANEAGSGSFSPARYDPATIAIYEGGTLADDPAALGHNPNEEHARWNTGPGDSILAARDDLNAVYGRSEPYVLVKYRDRENGDQWEFDVIRVTREVTAASPIPGCPCVEDATGPCTLHYGRIAAQPMRPPLPLGLEMTLCPEDTVITEPTPEYLWSDDRGGLWFVRGGDRGVGTADVVARFYERWDAECTPWLDDGSGVPVDVRYTVRWPQTPSDPVVNPPGSGPDVYTSVAVGETVDRSGFRRAQILYNDAGVSLIMPWKPTAVPLDEVPPDYWGRFEQLPPHLRARLDYDMVGGQLLFRGDQSLGLLGIMSAADRDAILAAFARTDPSPFNDAVRALYAASQQEGARELGYVLHPGNGDWGIAVASGSADASGYVVIGYNGRRDIADPVQVEVLKVSCPPFRGAVQVVYPDCPFDEQIVLRWSGDCGGDCAGLEFHWQVAAGDNPDDYDDVVIDGTPAPPVEPWQDYVDPERAGASGFVPGQNEIVVRGANVRTLTDNWFHVRTRGYSAACGQVVTGEFTDARLAEGWIKRVKRGINPFDQRADQFHRTAAATYVSMIEQLGTPMDDLVALTCDPDVVNNMGLIEIYEAVLARGRSFTIDLGVSYPPADQALILMAGSLVDFSMLLANEAYGDALDPTVGIDVGQSAPASALFCFQDQLPTDRNSLIYEELALLRGRDDTDTRVDLPPVYNRLYWNFSLGDGQIAYKNNYNVQDRDSDGDQDADDAAVMFPQGHGDAWGHYLAAQKYYYQLLRHPHFHWPVRSEYVRIGEQDVRVSYAHERRFARAASARAKCGAEILDLTYREQYVEDPAAQWGGYPDPVPGRSWGVADWGRRAFIGAHLDWVAANSLLRAADIDHPPGSVQRVDRTTVAELAEIALLAEQIPAKLDEADAGLNPLGLQKNVVPFDIDPSEIVGNKTHFEQIYERASTTLNNAVVVFDYANDLANSLRRHQDEQAEFQRNTQEREIDFRNRLIEIFGYPYPEDRDPLTGAIYGLDFEGPDLYHWDYVDIEDVLGVRLPEGETFEVFFNTPVVDAETGALTYVQTAPVEFNVVPGFGLITPRRFTIERKAPGEIQLARSDLLQAQIRFRQALAAYDDAIRTVEDQVSLLRAFYDLSADQIRVLRNNQAAHENLNDLIRDSRETQHNLTMSSRQWIEISNAAASAVGNDPFAYFAAQIRLLGVGMGLRDARSAGEEALNELEYLQAKESLNNEMQIELAEIQNAQLLEGEQKRLLQMLRALNAHRMEGYSLQESVRQASGRYLAAITRGQRLWQDLIRFRTQTAAQVGDFRYRDMAFRIFRNDALQKYRAQFDLAARYIYLAAKAYDYETALLAADTKAGEAFLQNIVRQRMIGEVESGFPVAGRGLADVLARLDQNFQVLKPQLGFNNPQRETNRFSLRYENFRIRSVAGYDDDRLWRQTLERSLVHDLRDHEIFRRLCDPLRQIVDSLEPEPGLVIPLGKVEEGIDRGTTITPGLNFFGWPLAGGDSAYSADNFATKVRSVGVWFSNYDNTAGETGLTQTPRVYLVPAGADVMRVPTVDPGQPRLWFLVDQVLPVPFPISQLDLVANPTWLPGLDNFGGAFEYGRPRRFGSFRAYHDGGAFDPAQVVSDNRLIGRSVWNTRWLLIIPGRFLYGDPGEGLHRFIYGGGDPGDGVSDIRIFFETYAYTSG